MKILAIALVGFAVACGSDPDTTNPERGVPNQVNECATPGATYLFSCTERAHGTCGPMTDRVINIDDPRITAIRCDSVSQKDCVAQASGCIEIVEVQGGTCELKNTYHTTFEKDGSSAKAVQTFWIKCSDKTSCSSSYDCTMTRQ